MIHLSNEDVAVAAADDDDIVSAVAEVESEPNPEPRPAGFTRGRKILLSVGIGLCVSNARAAIEGLLSKESGEFVRTPKYMIENNKATIQKKKYQAKMSMKTVIAFIELAMAVGFLFIIGYSIEYQMYGAVPFQALFCIGFFYVAFLSFFQGRLTTR